VGGRNDESDAKTGSMQPILKSLPVPGVLRVRLIERRKSMLPSKVFNMPVIVCLVFVFGQGCSAERQEPATMEAEQASPQPDRPAGFFLDALRRAAKEMPTFRKRVEDQVTGDRLQIAAAEGKALRKSAVLGDVDGRCITESCG
jgi:hypothetical protein